MNIYRLTPTDIRMLDRFIDAYPNWWYKIGVCDLTRDFDCAPQGDAKEAKWIEPGNIWDDRFSCDHEGTVADAIADVMAQISDATERAKGVESE